MSVTLVIVLLVLIAGERAADRLERRQQELVLGKLPVPEAHAYYERLRRRSRRIRILRALTVASLLTLAYVYRHAAVRRAPSAPPSGTASQLLDQLHEHAASQPRIVETGETRLSRLAVHDVSHGQNEGRLAALQQLESHGPHRSAH
jgi:S-adenosylmethionine:diacylglycerol 3-amino-3-carboxypropyl transferase